MAAVIDFPASAGRRPTLINARQSRKYFEARLGHELAARTKISRRCPFHDDQQPSFSLNPDQGVWKCFAGCGQGGILDFEMKFSNCDRDTARQKVNEVIGEQAFSTGNAGSIATYSYLDARGSLLYQKLRYSNPKSFRYRHEDESGNWVWSKGDRYAPYGLPDLVTAANVIYVEGEKDADNVRTELGKLNLNGRGFAVTTSGGANDWRDEFAPYFAGRDVVILPDNDTPGRVHAQQVAAAIHEYAAGVKVVDLPNLPDHGDVSNFLETHSARELLDEIQKHKIAWKPKEAPDDWKLPFHTREEIENAPPLKFAIDGFLQDDGVTLIGALPGHGKTLCMLAMVRALLEGTKLFTKFQARVSSRVLYLIPEAGLAPFVHRLKLFRLMEYVGDRFLFQTLSSKDPLSITDPRLLKAAEGADVFLDTAIRFMEGDENDASEHRAFAQSLFDLQRAGAQTITGAHHSPKAFARDNCMTLENVLRGSGDIGAMVCTAWGLKQIDPVNNSIYVANVKPRDFEPCEPFIICGRPSLDETGYFEMTDPPGFAGELADHSNKGGRPEREDKGEKMAEAWRLKAEGKSLQQIADQLDVPRPTIQSWLNPRGKKV
jgi:AAA domain/CHC2 zinc finger